MKCEFIENLVLSTPEKLDDKELIEVQEHLKQCDACRALLATHKMLVDSIPVTELSPEHEARLKKRVFQTIAKEKTPEKTVTTGFFARLLTKLQQPSFAIGFMLVIITVGWSIFSYKSGRPTKVALTTVNGSFRVAAEGRQFARQGEYRLDASETLLVLDGQPCQIKLTEGQQINANGRFTLNIKDNCIQVAAARGKLEFATGGREVLVALPEFTFSVRSTIVDLVVDEKVNRVDMVKGSIEILLKNGSRQILPEGQSFVIKPAVEGPKHQEPKPEPVTASSAEAIDQPIASIPARIHEDASQTPSDKPIATEPADLPAASAAEPVRNLSIGDLNNAF